MPIQDFKANDVGHLDVKLYPCTQDGAIIEDKFVEDPNELVGQQMFVLFKIDGAKGLPGRIAESFAQYEFLGGDLQKTTQTKGINPIYQSSAIGW